MKYKILDWAGNPKISDKRFDSTDDAWHAIYEALPDVTDEELGEFQVVEENEFRKKDRYLDPKDPRSTA